MRVYFLLVPFVFSLSVHAQLDCSALFRAEQKAFAEILHRKNNSLHMAPEVLHEQARLKRLLEVSSQTPSDKITSFLEALERVHLRAQIDSRVKERLRNDFYDRFVIKAEDIPDSYFQLQQRIAKARGHGDIQITAGTRLGYLEILITDQKKSLDSWFDYFLSSDAQSYPFYLKYWSFTSMLKLSKIDLELGVFLKRNKSTVALFPELNREALAHVTDQLAKKLKGEPHYSSPADDTFKALLDRADFGGLYARELRRLHAQSLQITSQRNKVDGLWVKYNQGSDPMLLVRSLEGKNTGWCTAGESTARQQLQNGDFYVFYSRDVQGKPTEPRVAIRMEGNSIGEIRGIGKEQHLDSSIAGSDVLKTKLAEFGHEGERYYKKDSDMNRLTSIVKRAEGNEELTAEELRFLYETEIKIDGFGVGRDPRIEALISNRNKRNDIRKALNLQFEDSEISFTKEEALRGGVKFHYGDLDLKERKSASGLKLPEKIRGNLNLASLTDAAGLRLPEMVGGTLNLNGLVKASKLRLPQTVEGNLGLARIVSADGFRFPESIGGNLDLDSLMTAEGLQLPASVGENLYLLGLEETRGLILPRTIGGVLYFPSKLRKNLKDIEISAGLRKKIEYWK